jgi:hypothetical protein
MTHPTAEQVFAALRHYFVDAFGVDEVECSFGIDDNFFVWIESLSFYDEIDFADVLWRWQQEWGIELAHSDFTEFLSAGISRQLLTSGRWEQDAKPLLTFRRLSQWLADRIEVPSLAPINIAGRDCGPAGAFVGIAEVVDRLAPGVRFPPQSRIGDHIRGKHLRQLWSRLNLRVDGKLPPLDRPYWNPGRLLIAATYAMLLVVIGLTGANYYEWLSVAFVLLNGVGLRVSCSWDPLPPQIKTFRDLAYLMSDIMNRPDPVQRPVSLQI